MTADRETFRDARRRRWRWTYGTPATDPAIGTRRDGEDYAVTLPEERRIAINTNKPARTLGKTRFHELVHVALDGAMPLPLADEERLIGVLEENLYPMLRRYGLRLDWKPRGKR